MASRRYVIVAAALLSIAALVGTATVFAQNGGPGFGGRGHRGFGMMAGLQQLGLSPDQQQQVQNVMASHRDEFKALMDRSRKAHEAQQAAIEQVPVNEDLIRSTATAVAAADADMAVLRAKVHEQVFSLLTPDQQTKAKQLQADRAARRAQRQAEWQQKMQQRQQQAQPQAAPPQQ
jgi:Spy/CpxP family protein refolding chaperone